jgi:hypothetical protein
MMMMMMMIALSDDARLLEVSLSVDLKQGAKSLSDQIVA